MAIFVPAVGVGAGVGITLGEVTILVGGLVGVQVVMEYGEEISDFSTKTLDATIDATQDIWDWIRPEDRPTNPLEEKIILSQISTQATARSINNVRIKANKASPEDPCQNYANKLNNTLSSNEKQKGEVLGQEGAFRRVNKMTSSGKNQFPVGSPEWNSHMDQIYGALKNVNSLIEAFLEDDCAPELLYKSVKTIRWGAKELENIAKKIGKPEAKDLLRDFLKRWKKQL